MSDYTPGPWAAEYAAYRDTWQINRAERSGWIADVKTRGAHDAEAAANARLIALAPRMAEALREIEALTAPLVQASDPLGFDIRHTARAILAELDRA